MPEENSGIESKKKRGRPKGTKNKPTTEPSIDKPIEPKHEKSKPALSHSEITAIAEAEAKAAAARLEAAKAAN